VEVEVDVELEATVVVLTDSSLNFFEIGTRRAMVTNPVAT
jgi:hypothetical protein